MSKKYKLYVDGLRWTNKDHTIVDYTIISHRDSKRAAMDYGRDVEITTMSNKTVSAAKIGADGNAYNVLIKENAL